MRNPPTPFADRYRALVMRTLRMPIIYVLPLPTLKLLLATTRAEFPSLELYLILICFIGESYYHPLCVASRMSRVTSRLAMMWSTSV